MFKPFEKEFILIPVPNLLDGEFYDQNFFANDVTGDTWPLTTTATVGGIANQFSIRNNSATDHSAKTVLIEGTYHGQAISETINLPATFALGNEITHTTQFFDVITNSPLTPSATIGADTMDLGITARGVSNAFPSGTYFGNLNLKTQFNFGANLRAEGTIDYAIDYTFSDVQTEPVADWNWLNLGGDFDNITDPTTLDFETLRPKAIRFRVNNHTSIPSFENEIVNLVIEQSYK